LHLITLRCNSSIAWVRKYKKFRGLKRGENVLKGAIDVQRVEKTRLLGRDWCTPRTSDSPHCHPVIYAHCWGKTLLPATITIGACHIWAMCPTREHCNLLFLHYSHDLFCYQPIMTGLFLLELATLQNLLHLINLVSAFPYELVASFANRSNLLKSWEKTETCEGSTSGAQGPKTQRSSACPSHALPRSRTHCSARTALV